MEVYHSLPIKRKPLMMLTTPTKTHKARLNAVASDDKTTNPAWPVMLT